MLQVMSQEEVDRTNRRVTELYESPLLVERLMGVLMDVSIGGFGMWESAAKAKAEAIMQLEGVEE